MGTSPWTRTRPLLRQLVICSCVVAPLPALAGNPLGTYVGAGVGQSELSVDGSTVGRAPGWKLFAGVRPLPWLGAEIEYVDFGHRSAATAFSGQTATAQARGAALFGLAYLPLGLFDVYGKAGVSRLHTSAVVPPAIPIPIDSCYFNPQLLGCHPVHDDRRATSFDWAGGVQVKLSSIALRAEYERPGSGSVRPSLSGLTVSWIF